MQGSNPSSDDSKRTKGSVVKNKYAGVTLDWYDDRGETLKSKFPTADSLPEIIKEADIQPFEKLSHEDFALRAIDEGNMLCKFACHDPGTTAMSVIYFMEHGDKLPETAQKVAAANLVDACRRYGLMPPEAMAKIAMSPAVKNALIGGGLGGLSGGVLAASGGNPETREGRALTGGVTGALGGAAVGSALNHPYIGAVFGGVTGGVGGKSTGFVHQRHIDELKEHLGEGQNKESSVINITGKRPSPKVKVAHSTRDEDYAVVLPNGNRHYPIHTWDLVKKAELYYQEEGCRMQPEIRRQFAVKLASKAYDMGYPLVSDIFEAGATDWAPAGHLKAAVEMRKVACDPSDDSRQFLDELLEKRASMGPDTYAEVLRRFDVQHGFDQVWNHVVLDPWASTFGINKTADVVWEDGADRVTSEQLQTLASRPGRLIDTFTEAVAKEFQKDPVGIFESMPVPQKRVLARLASDLGHESEAAVL